jgi:hypothetical protein
MNSWKNARARYVQPGFLAAHRAEMVRHGGAAVQAMSGGGSGVAAVGHGFSAKQASHDGTRCIFS